MGIFGNFQPTQPTYDFSAIGATPNVVPSLAGPVPGPQLAPPMDTPSDLTDQIPQDQAQSAQASPPAPGGLFGGGWNKDKVALTLAGLSDAIDPLTMHPTGGGTAAKLRQQQMTLRSQKVRRDAFSAAYDPTTGKFDGKKFVSTLAGNPDGTVTDDDATSFLAAPKVSDVGGKGYTYNADSGKYELAIDPGPKPKEDYNIPGIGRFDGNTNKPIALEPGVTLGQAAAAQGGQGAPTASAAPTATPAVDGPVYKQISDVAAANGAKPEEVPYLKRLAQVESGGNPAAKNQSSTGVFQFHPDTFAAAGGGNINDVGDQTKAALNLSRADRASLQDAGLPTTDANVYLLHQQGSAGGRALLQAPPEVGAIAALAPAYKGSTATAQRAIGGNIGLPYKTAAQQASANAIASNMTAGQFTTMWQNRWNGMTPTQARQAALAAPQAQGPSASPMAIPGGPTAAADPNGPMTFSKATGHASTDAELASVHLPAGTPAWTDEKGKIDPYPASVTGGGGGADDIPLSPAAIDLQAGMYLKDRTLPPLGMGKTAAANRAKILNRATDIASSLGLSPEDILSGAMTVKAAGSALSKATAIRSQVEGNEQTVIKNADYALSLAPKGGGQTGIPVLNRFTQHLRGEYGGDPDVTQFQNAIGTVADEYAKVMTSTTGAGGASSEGARAEAYSRLSKSSTLPQLQANIAAMKVEMANRVNSMRDVEAGLRSQVRSGGAEPSPAASQPAAPSPGRGIDPQAAVNRYQTGLQKGEFNTNAPFGSKPRPYVARDQATLDRLKPGVFVISPNGVFGVTH